VLEWLSTTDSNSIVPVVLQLTLAVVMFPHGGQKAFGSFSGHGFKETMQAKSWPSPLVSPF